MSTAVAGEPGGELIFNWRHGRSRKFLMAGFIAASAAGHALCFYIFQIVYPPTIALLPPPARVNLIVPDSEEGRALLNWIEAEDPALVFTTQRPAETKAFALPKVEHVPSYMTTEPLLKPVPPYTPDLRVPSSQPPGPVPFPRAAPPKPLGPVKTIVAFSAELEGLGAVEKPESKFTASSHEQPTSAGYLIAVGPRGDVRYCFLRESSGDPGLDEQARHYLTLCRFRPAAAAQSQTGEHLVWGHATVEWGNDVATPPSANRAAKP